MTIILPSSHRVELNLSVDYVPDGVNVVFSYSAGLNIAPWTEVTPSDGNALEMVAQIDAIVAAAKQGIFIITGSPATLKILTPNPFMAMTDTLSVYGSGFDFATLGTLYAEDSSGGLTGVSFTTSFNGSTWITGVFNADGGGGSNGKMVYVDSNGIWSNTLAINPPLVWTLLTPTTYVHNTPGFRGDITGSGFIGAGLGVSKLDDGAGNVIATTIIVNSGTDATLASATDPDGVTFPAAGTYTLFYSQDSGMTYRTTGLSTVVS